MKQIIILIVVGLITFIISTKLIFQPAEVDLNQPHFWQVQSIDTMKYSRDAAKEKLNDSSFDQTIDQQIREISQIGATHVAISTPYDEEFIPILTRWVKAARKYQLKVWFRGNFSGWEKWFGYEGITRDEHLTKTRNFIDKHRDLFENGDIFTACPECENGGPGDPRRTGDIEGFRSFMIAEHRLVKTTFFEQDKNIIVNLISMNKDVADVVMDKKTTQQLEGVVTIDHYVETPEKLISDIRALAQKSGGKIFIGEFGVPIPDINGTMTEQEQAQWIKKALGKLINEPEVIGLNYWVSAGGSTQLWNDNGSPRSAVQVVRLFFKPRFVTGQIVDRFSNPIANIKVIHNNRTYVTDKNGYLSLPYLSDNVSISISVEGYSNKELTINPGSDREKIIIEKKQTVFFDTVKGLLKAIFRSL